MMDLTTAQWAGLAVVALLAGLSKGGVVGLGVLVAALAANVLPAKAATGFVLPLLIVGDLAGLRMFHRHADWSQLWRLVPWTAAGVIVGWLTLGHVDDEQAKLLIGAMLVAMVTGHLEARRRSRERTGTNHEPPSWLAPLAGLLAGFTTLVANAAGPVMVVYLLAMRLPKLQFLGTAAWFFCLLNLLKVPFMVHLGLIDGTSLATNALLLPVVVLGALAGRWLVQRLNQERFEALALALSLLAGVKMLVW
jgi:uncharacterized membrane protein YfcA